MSNLGPATTVTSNTVNVLTPVNTGTTTAPPQGANARRLLASGRAINVNTTGDTAVMPVINAGTWAVTEVILTNASISLTTATYGIFTAAAGGGTGIVAASTALSGLTGPTVVGKPTVVAGTLLLNFTGSNIYFNLNVAQGAAATLDCFIYGYDLS